MAFNRYTFPPSILTYIVHMYSPAISRVRTTDTYVFCCDEIIIDSFECHVLLSHIYTFDNRHYPKGHLRINRRRIAKITFLDNLIAVAVAVAMLIMSVQIGARSFLRIVVSVLGGRHQVLLTVFLRKHTNTFTMKHPMSELKKRDTKSEREIETDRDR